MSFPDWLPDMICLEDYGGSWEVYLEAIYKVFKADFIDSIPRLIGMRVGVKKYTKLRGKESSFWHLIQEGDIEIERLPNFRRCERIPWPRPIIDNYPNNAIKFWKNERRGRTRILLWLWECDYLVVIEDRGDYLLLITAYPIENEPRRRKLEKERVEYWNSIKASAAPKDDADTFSTRGR